MEVRWKGSSEVLLLEWVCVGASKHELELQGNGAGRLLEERKKWKKRMNWRFKMVGSFHISRPCVG